MITFAKPPVLIFTYGFPAAGKTTYSNKLYKDFIENGCRASLISADKIREELYGSQDTYGDPMVIYKEILSRMREDLLTNEIVIYDAVNLRKDYRLDYLNNIKDIDCVKYIIKLCTDKETCIERHKNRGRDIPIENLMPYFDINEPPTYEEGWDFILERC